MSSDIENREDLEKLMQHFYSKMLADETVAYLFIEVAQMDLESHIPRIVDFWENLLFNTCEFKGNVFDKHLQLHHASALNKEHFDTWLMHFNSSVDANFKGSNAERIKTRALSIATIMQSKILNLA